MVPRDTRTGGVLESTIIPCLKRNGYLVSSQQIVGLKPNGRKHRIDAVVDRKNGTKVLVSLKWQQTGGTAEEKVPFEVIKLIYTLNNDKQYDSAYLVLGGDAWTLKEWYLHGNLEYYVPESSLVKIVTLEQFITICNKKQL